MCWSVPCSASATFSLTRYLPCNCLAPRDLDKGCGPHTGGRNSSKSESSEQNIFCDELEDRIVLEVSVKNIVLTI